MLRHLFIHATGYWERKEWQKAMGKVNNVFVQYFLQRIRWPTRNLTSDGLDQQSAATLKNIFKWMDSPNAHHTLKKEAALCVIEHMKKHFCPYNLKCLFGRWNATLLFTSCIPANVAFKNTYPLRFSWIPFNHIFQLCIPDHVFVFKGISECFVFDLMKVLRACPT